MRQICQKALQTSSCQRRLSELLASLFHGFKFLTSKFFEEICLPKLYQEYRAYKLTKLLTGLRKPMLLLCQGLKPSPTQRRWVSSSWRNFIARIACGTHCNFLASGCICMHLLQNHRAFFNSLTTSFSCATCATSESECWSALSSHTSKSACKPLPRISQFHNANFFIFQAAEMAFPAISASKQAFALTASEIAHHANTGATTR